MPTPTNETDDCQRCKLPIIGTRYSFRVDATPPIPSANPVEITICTACLESMQRWMGRHQRRGEASIPGSSDSHATSTPRSHREKTRSHGSSSNSRSRYDEQLKNAERWLRIRAGLTISAVVLAFTTLFVLIAVEISGYSPAYQTSAAKRSIPKPPPLPTVDPTDLE